jgi:threonylcarbamoyladenosine tRNA methylthiotransferase MtaB
VTLDLKEKPPTKSDVEVVTFGCRLNAYESEVMRAKALEAGLTNAIIVNTCAVTAEAVRQSRQTIRRLRRENPTAQIVVTGCAAQTEPETYAEMDEVDRIIGNAEKMSREGYLPDFGTGQDERVRVSDIMDVRETASHLLAAFDSRARAFVQVQNGCDHRCTFCIIPFGRGPSRSVPAGAVVEQVRTLTDTGVKEIVLTGVDLTAYGADLPGAPPLGRLVEQILKHVPALTRLRLSSIDVAECDARLVDLIASDPRIMPHIHLSLQAGDDMILKRMKRRHTRAQSVAFCDELRGRRPDLVFGADIIAGFPTETEEMAANTLKLVDDCGLTWLHVFPFSARKGTPAARMPKVHGDAIKARAAALRQAGAAAVERLLENMQNQTHGILMETETEGRHANYAAVHLDRPATPGAIQRVHIIGRQAQKLIASPI